MAKRKEQPEDAEIAAAIGRELGAMEEAILKVKKKGAKRLGFHHAALRYAQGDVTGAVEILRQAVARLRENEPYRYYMLSVLADWMSEAGEAEEAGRLIELAWAGVAPGGVYFEEIKERKGKVEWRLK